MPCIGGGVAPSQRPASKRQGERCFRLADRRGVLLDQHRPPPGRGPVACVRHAHRPVPRGRITASWWSLALWSSTRRC